jgi:glycerophosphoryl diester phosphodiesterase
VLFGPGQILCGHRGSGRGVVEGQRENTLGSFWAAVEAGIPWVEVDSRATADGVLVARHDPVAPDGRWVAELTGAETDALGIMRLADLLEDLPPEIGVDVDIKTAIEDALRPRERTTAALTAALVEPYAGGRPLLLSGFDASSLLIVRERLPDVPVGLLTWARFPLRKAIPAAVHLGAAVVAPHATSFPEPGDGQALERPAEHSVDVAHRAGLEVLGWGGSHERAAELFAAGVDCVCVDDAPEAARAAQRASRPKRSLRRW